MLIMHHKSQYFKLRICQTKQHSCTHIFYSCFHCPVKRCCMIVIVPLQAFRVNFFIDFFIISFLEQYVSSYSLFIQSSIIFNCCCSYIYIYSSYFTIFIISIINCIYCFKYIFYITVYRIFPCFQCKSFMSHFFKYHNFLFYFFH